MQTSNVANATGPVMNWVDEIGASFQSHYADDVSPRWTRPGRWATTPA
jgi:hypothetical protein